MPAKNLFLDKSVADAGSAYAAKNIRHKNLSRLVEHLLIREMRANAEKTRKACREKRVPIPEIIFGK